MNTQLRNTLTLGPIAAFAIFSAPLAAAQAVQQAGPAPSDAAQHAAIEIPAPPEIPADAVQFTLQLPEDERLGFVAHIPLEPGGEAVPIIFDPISVRDDEFQFIVQTADGTLVESDPGPERTFTATPPQYPGVEIAAGFVRGGLIAAVYRPDAPMYWIQPRDPNTTVSPGNAVEHIAYGCDAEPDGSTCGNTEFHAPGAGHANPALGGCGTGGSTCRAQVAFDADFEFYQSLGSSTVATRDHIAALLNVVNHQYRREVGIWHDITALVVRTAEPDPYTQTDSFDLLNQFGIHWNATFAATPRDVAHLCTGKDLDGTVRGRGVFDAVCNPGIAYSISMANYTSIYCRLTNLLAHELAHNWSAQHCPCPNSTMYESNICANTFAGAGSDSLAAITAWRDSVACLDTETPPTNDLCVDAQVVVRSGVYFGNNIDAATDGGALGCGIAFPGDIGGGRRDVWYRVSPGASGDISVSTCGSAFDTVLSVHTGCPGTPDNQVACNDDSCGVQSEITFAGQRGTTYYVRIAGFGSATGAILASFTMPVPENNNCASATVLTPGIGVNGYLGGSTDDGDGCAQGAGASDVWYSFTAACSGTLTLDTCGSNDRLGLVDQGVDTALSVHSSCPGNLANMLACNNNTAVCDNDAGLRRDSRIILLMSAGQTVYIRVTWVDQFGSGAFFLHNEFQPTTLIPQIAPIPDDSHPAAVAYVGPIPQVTNAACIEDPTWSLFAAPPGMTIDAATGVVNWPAPTAVGSPHTVTIRAANTVGLDLESWLLTIEPGPCAGERGDANCDGSLDFFDIDPFLQALFDWTAYQAAYCNAGRCGVDTNCDGNVDFFDIDPLLNCLFAGCAPCP